jgi:hypothetical protein
MTVFKPAKKYGFKLATVFDGFFMTSGEIAPFSSNYKRVVGFFVTLSYLSS